MIYTIIKWFCNCSKNVDGVKLNVSIANRVVEVDVKHAFYNSKHGWICDVCGRWISNISHRNHRILLKGFVNSK